jgi:hypothetical protein
MVMLLIRDAQMQAFRADMRGRFVERMMLLFTRLWPQKAALLGDGYQRFIESSIEHAESYSIGTEAAIARFVNLCLVWGPDFEMRPEHQWALLILKNPEMRGAVKVNELAFRTRVKLRHRPANWRCPS